MTPVDFLGSIRLGRDCDRDAILAVFDSNVPAFFSAIERPRLETFLDNAPDQAWVAQADDGTIAGFGAVTWSDPDTAWLRWGMVAQGQHRRGIGKALLQIRMDWIRHETQ
ncbi:MAG: GNAT family N-acetyltransferase [Thermomicrobiales bacterium]